MNASELLRPAPVATLAAPPASALRSTQRRLLLEAGAEVRDCHRVLAKAGLNIVGEVLKGQGEFVEFDHYPRDDVFDDETASQYYYHAHRAAEHGHFHTFLRAKGMPKGVAPLNFPARSEPWPSGSDAHSHLIAISMDAYGLPIGLFATNRWVTGETWYPCEDVIRMLDRYEIDHAFPSWPVNRWVSAMMVLFRPHIETLLRHRDRVVASWQKADPGLDAFEDRRLETTGSMRISLDAWIEELAADLTTPANRCTRLLTCARTPA